MEGNRHLTLVYQQKADAPTSYYLQEGETGYLPGRVCLNRKPFIKVKGSNRTNPVAQFKATFKIAEMSPYRNDTRTLHSNIYPVNTSVEKIIGTADIRWTNDLLIFEDRSDGKWQTIAIHIYPGCKFKAAEILSCF